MRLLIVEDDKPLRAILVHAFLREGFEVMEAADGLSGLLKARKNHPDLIISGLEMPGIDGITLMKKIRREVWGKDLPIVLLTSLQFDDNRMRDVVEYKPSFYFVKSDWKLEDVVRKVKERLGVHEGVR